MGNISKAERERVENKLRQYPVIKKRIVNISARIRMREAELEEDHGYSLPAVSYSGVGGGNTNRVNQREQDAVVRKLEPDREILRLLNERRKLEAERDAIKAGLDVLNDIQSNFVRLRYFRGMQFKGVASKINVSEREAYEIRDEIVGILVQFF